MYNLLCCERFCRSLCEEIIGGLFGPHKVKKTLRHVSTESSHAAYVSYRMESVAKASHVRPAGFQHLI
jgi:hypothetical protein